MFNPLRALRQRWLDWVTKPFFRSQTCQGQLNQRGQQNYRQQLWAECLEDRCLLASPNLYLQSVIPEATGFATNVAPGGTALVNTNGELTVQFATGLANFSASGFNGATLYFLYDHTVFAPLTSVASVNSQAILNDTDTTGAAREINLANTLLANAIYPNRGQGLLVNIAVTANFSGNYDLVQVNIGDADGTSQIASPSSNVLIGINLEPLTTVTSSSLLLFNRSTSPSKPDVISPSSGANYALGLPTLATTALNATYDFSASVQSNTLPTLALGGWMNTASGAVAAIPVITTANGTATVYANIKNPLQTGSGLDMAQVVFNYDPTVVTIASPTFGGSFQLGSVFTMNGADGQHYRTSVSQFSVSVNDMEVVVGIYDQTFNGSSASYAITNAFLGDLFHITLTLANGVASPSSSPINLTSYSQGGPGNPLTYLEDSSGKELIFTPGLGSPLGGNDTLDTAIFFSTSGELIPTSTTLSSSSPVVTYGTAVTFSDTVSAASGLPPTGRVEFYDVTTGNRDLGGASPSASSGSSTVFTLSTSGNTLNSTSGDVIRAVYIPGPLFSVGADNGSATTTQVVNKLAINVTAAPNAKTYDGSVSASNSPSITGGSLVNGDSVAFTETYDTQNAGTGITLTPAGSVSDGNGGLNYSYTFIDAATGSITARPITVTAASNTKIYDSTTSASNTPTITDGALQGSDTAAFFESYNSKNANRAAALTPAGSVNDGNGGQNYSYTFMTGTGAITARALTVTAATCTKVYDNTNSASSVPTITGGFLQGTDTAAFTETFDDLNAGTSKALVPAGSVSDGNSGSNYSVTFVDDGTGVITRRAITVTAVTNTKVYDNTISASSTPLIASGSLQGSDTAAFKDTYDTPNVGTGKTLTPAGSVNDGKGGSNYAVTFVNIVDGAITVRAITVTAATNTKFFDGTTSALNTPTITAGSVQGSDAPAFIESYDTPNTGTGKTLTPAGSVNDGNGGNNYAVSFVVNTTGVIGIITATELNTALASVVYGTTVTFRATVTAAFESGALTTGSVDFLDVTTNSDLGKGVFAGSSGGKSTWTLGIVASHAAANFKVTSDDLIQATYTPASGFLSSSDVLNLAIRPASLTVTATAANKPYDGTTTATVTLSDNRSSGDVLTDAYTIATFSDPNPGVGKTVTVTGIAISGPDAGNYNLTSTTATTTANIGAFIWSGGAGASDENWTIAANWAGGVAPSAGAYLYFPSGPTQTLTYNDFGAGTGFSGILIAASGYTLAGNALTLQQGLSDSGGNAAVSVPITLGGTQSIVNSSSGTLTLGPIDQNGYQLTLEADSGTTTVNGQISGAGGLVITGDGTVILAMANTFTGTAQINAGTLAIQNPQGLGAGAGIVVNSGSTLDLSSAEGVIVPATESVTINGSGFGGYGAIDNLGGSSFLAGPIILGSDAGVGSDENLLLPVTIPNFSFETPNLGRNYQYNPTGASWTFLGSGANNNSGIAANGSGFSPPSAPDGTQAALLQGAGSFSQSITFPEAGNYVLTFAAAGRNNGAGSNPFHVLVDGTQVGTSITPANNVYANYSIAFQITSSGAHTLMFAGLGIGGADVTSFIDDIILQVTAATPNMLTLAGTVNLNGFALTATGSANTTVSGLISGAAGGVIMAGSGTLSLANANNSYGGGTTVNAGTLAPTVSGALGPGAVNVNSGGVLDVAGDDVLGAGGAITINSGGVMDIAVGLIVNTTRSVVLNGSGPFGNGAIESLGGSSSFTDPITLGSSASIGSDLNLTPVTVPNYSFETPNLGSAFQYNPTGASWIFQSPGNGPNNSGITGNGSSFGPPNAPDGTQAALLEGTGSFSQSIMFPGAGDYMLTFAYAPSSSSNPFQVSVDGTQIGTTIAPAIASNSFYETHSIRFHLGSGGPHTLEFAGQGNGGDDVTTYIDDITLGELAATSDTLTLSGTVNLNGYTLTVVGSGNTTVSGQITGNTAGVAGSGLIGEYFDANAPNLQWVYPFALLPPDVAGSQPALYIGAAPPTATALTPNIDFPDIADYGFVEPGFAGFPSIYGSNVSAVWSGIITIPGSGTAPVNVTFKSNYDDWFGLFIDNQEVLLNNDLGNPRTVALTPGPHKFDASFVQEGGGAFAVLSWDAGTGKKFGVIPSSAFSIPANGVTKAGSGTLTLAGVNNYSGPTTIDDGLLVPTVDGAMGPATAGGIIVNSGGALAIPQALSYSTLEPINISGSGPSGSGAIEYFGANNSADSLSLPISLGSNATIGADGGTLTLANANLNLLDGNLTLTGAGNLVIPSALAGTATNTVTKAGTGTATLSGNNTYTGLTIVYLGTLVAAANNALGSNGAIVDSGATLALQGNITLPAAEILMLSGAGVGGAGALENLTGANTLAGPIIIQNSTIGGSTAGGANTLTLTGNITNGLGAASSTLTFTGAGIIQVNGSIQPSVLTTGELVGDYYNNLNPFYAGIPLNPTDNRSLFFQTPLITEPLTVPINLPNIDTESFTQALTTGAAAGPDIGTTALGVLWTGTITIPSTAGGGGTKPVPITLFTASDDGSRLWLDGSSLTSPGTLVVNNDYDQAQAQQQGTVDLVPGSTHTITIGYYQYIGDAAMAVDWDLTGGNNPTLIPASAFSVPAAIGNLAKTGTGTVILAAANTVTGSTTISNGTLEVDGSLTALNTVDVTGAGALAGTGTVTSNDSNPNERIRVEGNARIDPGNAAATGTLTLGNSLRFFNTGSFVNIRLKSAGQYDQVEVQGDVALNSAALNVTLNFTPILGQTFTILNNEGTGPIVGTFRGLAEGSQLVVGQVTFRISYVGGNGGNDVVLTVVGAPAMTTTVESVSPGAIETYGTPITLSATVSVTGGPLPIGRVTFVDRTTNITLGSSSTTPTSSTATSNTWSFSPPANQLKVTSGDIIEAFYNPGSGFVTSNDSLTEVITKRSLTITAAANTKIYDAATTSSATPTVTSGSLASGDTLAFTETFDTPNAGTARTLTASGSISDGDGGNNYVVTLVNNTTGTITPRPLTVMAATNTKGYDGTASASNTPTITSGNLVSGDTASFTESYDTKNMGGEKKLIPSGSINDGNGGQNYSVTFITNHTGAITPSLQSLTGTSAYQPVAVGSSGTSPYGMPVTFTYTAIMIGASTPQGTVQFFENGTPLGASSLQSFSGTTATWIYKTTATANSFIPQLPGGTDFITAHYAPPGAAPVISPTWTEYVVDGAPAGGMSRRFDFNAGNGNAGATQPGFFGALASDSLANIGEGWTSYPSIINTGTSGGTINNLLYQDIVYGYGTTIKTFEMAATPGTTYSLRLYLGDSRSTSGNLSMQVRAYGSASAAPAFTTVTTTAGYFNDYVIQNVTADSSGIIKVDIKSSTATAEWAIAGIDIWTGANDPGQAPQMATIVTAVSSVAALTQAQLAPAVQPIVQVQALTGMSSVQLAALSSVTYLVGNAPTPVDQILPGSDDLIDGDSLATAPAALTTLCVNWLGLL